MFDQDVIAQAALSGLVKGQRMTPQIILTLSPSGSLVAELPGANGMRRPVPIDSLASISRILHAQIGRSNPELGTDGAPTQRQVKHWEKHGKLGDPQCPFCRQEGKYKIKATARQLGNYAEKMRVELEFGNHGLEKIRRIPATSRKLAPPSRTTQYAPLALTIKGLGL